MRDSGNGQGRRDRLDRIKEDGTIRCNQEAVLLWPLHHGLLSAC